MGKKKIKVMVMEELMIGKLSGSKLHTVWRNLERTQVSSPFLDFPVYTVDS